MKIVYFLCSPHHASDRFHSSRLRKGFRARIFTGRKSSGWLFEFDLRDFTSTLSFGSELNRSLDKDQAKLSLSRPPQTKPLADFFWWLVWNIAPRSLYISRFYIISIRIIWPFSIYCSNKSDRWFGDFRRLRWYPAFMYRQLVLWVISKTISFIV